MKLVVIYGPPAAGKLTVAKELAKITGFKIFHNHLTNDLLSSVLKFGTQHYWAHVHDMRMNVLKIAAKHKVKGVIYTFCYAHKLDDKNVKHMLKSLGRHDVKFFFVNLYCSKDELFKRVSSDSRKKFGKIKHRKVLTSVLKKWELFKPIPYVKNLEIDNTRMSPKMVAKKIKAHYEL